MTVSDLHALVDHIDATPPHSPLRSRSLRSVASDVAAGLFVVACYGVITAWRRVRR